MSRHLKRRAFGWTPKDSGEDLPPRISIDPSHPVETGGSPSESADWRPSDDPHSPTRLGHRGETADAGTSPPGQA
jgi:hypothetical protein